MNRTSPRNEFSGQLGAKVELPLKPLSDDQRAELARLGPEHVRLKVAAALGKDAGLESFVLGLGGVSISLDAIDDWLADTYRQEQEKRRRSEASDIEQARIARGANRAAWIAAWAIAATIVGLVCLYIFSTAR